MLFLQTTIKIYSVVFGSDYKKTAKSPWRRAGGVPLQAKLRVGLNRDKPTQDKAR